MTFGCGQKRETNINISLQLYEGREMRSRGLFSVIRVEKLLQPEEWFAFLETWEQYTSEQRPVVFTRIWRKCK